MIGPFPADARWRSPAFPGSRMSSTWRRTTAEFGRRPTSAAPGIRFSMTSQHGSIGALAVAPSNPDTIYVGSGEGLRRPDLSVGDGIYKSTDAGRTWQHLGTARWRSRSRPSSSIPKIPNRVFVAALGHPYGPNAERGVFRSLDGGQTWKKVLYKDENTGAMDLVFDPSQLAGDLTPTCGPRAVRRGRPAAATTDRAAVSTNPPTAANLAATHQRIADVGRRLGRIGPAVAPSDPDRMYALGRRTQAERHLSLRRCRRKLAADQYRRTRRGDAATISPACALIPKTKT